MLYVVVAVLVFGGGGAIFVAMRQRAGKNPLSIAARLGRYGLAGPGQTVTLEKVSQSSVRQSVDKMVERGGLAAPVTAKLERADLKMTPSEFLAIAGAAFVIAAFVGFLFKGILGFLGLGLIALVLPWVYLWRRGKKRRRNFIEQLADMAQMMGNSMRAGFSIMQSMELVGREGPEPASHEFDRVVTEVKLGLPLDQALDHLVQRMPSEDLELMIVAINVQRQIGGNLSEILAVISHTIRERVRFERDLRSLTAQARYSSYIITALPVGVAVVINFMDREYESYLYSATLGHIMLAVAVVMLAMGFFFLNRIANIEV